MPLPYGRGFYFNIIKAEIAPAVMYKDVDQVKKVRGLCLYTS